ncbi:MAG: HalOD1 output domain-containing protein [Haloarculaceae archaeon]
MTRGTAQTPIVEYRRTDEPVFDAVMTAFSQHVTDVVPDEEKPVYEWVDFEALEALVESAREGACVTTFIWGHRVVITPETVEIYDR